MLLPLFCNHTLLPLETMKNRGIIKIDNLENTTKFDVRDFLKKYKSICLVVFVDKTLPIK
jgi:hypothetical protein